MKYSELKNRHDELETEVLDALRTEIENSTEVSDHVNQKCLNVNVFDYEELVILHDRLTFIDDAGLQYGLYTECSLEDLIDILTKI